LISTASNFLRDVRARWHSALGSLSFRFGRHGAAERRFHRVLELRGADFTAYLALSRIACAQGNYRGWLRESEHARRLSPQRFDRLRHRFSLPAPHTAGALLYETEERATWRPSPPARPAFGGTGRQGQGFDSARVREAEDALAEALEWFDRMDVNPDAAADSSSESAADAADNWLDRAADGVDPWEAPAGCHRGLRFGDDFSSDHERRRFSASDPISPDEIEANDLDDLVRRLGSC